MSMNGRYGEFIKIRYVSADRSNQFIKGKVYNATFLKNDPQKKWYIIKDFDGEEYAYPRSWFEIVHD